MQTMNYKEAAGFLKITEGTLRNWVSVGRIKPRKVGKRVLFFREELEAWITGVATPADDPRPHPAKPAAEAKAHPPDDPAGPVTWNARFQLSFSAKAEGDPFAYLETMPGKSVKMTPDNMRELARYLVDAANMCDTPTYRGIQHHRIMREPLDSLSTVCLIPHDFMRDLQTLAHAAARTNDLHAATPEKYAIKFIADGLRAQQPIINQRLKERGSRAVHFISVR
jgi:excisionase family DNA binding protein